MKKNILFIALALVLLMAVPAHSGNGLYVGGNIGLSMMRDVDTDYFVVPVNFKFEPGYALGAVVGYGHNYFRGEAELMYQKSNLDKADITGFGEVGASGDVSNLAFLLNGYFDIKNPSIVTPYLTAGIGVSRVDVDSIKILGLPITTKKSYDDTVFAYQVGAGVGFDVTKNITIDLKYRYFGTSDVKIDSEKFTNASHNIYLGMRYSF